MVRETDEPDALPLQEARLAWCDPQLVEAWRAAHAEDLPAAVAMPSRYWRRPTDDWVAFLRAEGRADAAHRARKPILERRAEAEANLVADFRDRVARGELVLTGLRRKPTLATESIRLPVIWLPLLKFLWTPNIIRIGQRAVDEEYIYIEVRRAGGAASAHPSVVEHPAAAGWESGAADNSPSPPARRPRGRASFEPLIEEALRANWDKVRALAARQPDGKPNWTTVGNLLLNWLKKHRASTKIMVPAKGTLRTRLPPIYERLLSENSVRKPIGQE